VTDTVLYEKRDRIAFVTLNRPGAKNAIDPDTHAALCDIWTDFRDDGDVDVAILSGAGDAFCAGADLRVASDRAMFGSFEARRGFHHGDGGITRLVNTCGVGVAMQLVLTAEPMEAERALQCNLVT
jgi:enoyl-CoA hydratase/carnithine racemase